MKSKRWCRGSVNFLKWFDVFEKWRTTDTVSAGFTQQGFSLWVLSSEIVLRSDFLCLLSFFKVTLHSHHLPHHVWYWYQELKCKFSLIGLVRWKFTPLCTQDILQASCIFGYSCVVSTIQIKGFVKPLVILGVNIDAPFSIKVIYSIMHIQISAVLPTAMCLCEAKWIWSTSPHFSTLSPFFHPPLSFI